MKYKLSDYVFNFLKENNVHHVFMLPGGGAMHLVDSLGTSEIEYVSMLHEQAASIAAEAYGQHTNHIGVVLVTSGPGGTNAITGVAAGWIDSTPMFIISGQAKRADLIGDKGVRQVGSQEVQIVDMVRPITKYAVMINEPESIRYHLERAFWEATHGRKGPVWIDIPLDVQAAKIESEALVGFSPDKELYNSVERKDCEEIIELLKKAKKPLILAGNGIYLSDAKNKFFELLEKTQIPVQTTWKAVDLVSEEHPLYAGHPGTMGDRGANLIMQSCDLLLALGARLDSSITAFNEVSFAPTAVKIVVDIDKNELSKFSMPIKKKIHGNVSELLKTMNNCLNRDELPDWSNWISFCKEKRKHFPVCLPEYEHKSDYVSGYYFTKKLCEILDGNDVIVPESAGVTAEVTYQAIKSKAGQKIKNAAGLGSMGFGLPYAIGSCIANGGRRTVLINGDGAFQLNIQELATLKRLNLPVYIFIWNNDGYASIRNMQRNNFAGRYVASGDKTGLVLPNIRSVAAAYGIDSIRIENNQQLDILLPTVFEQKSPFLCELMIDPDEIVSPKVMSKIDANGNMIPGTLDNMWPFLNET